MKEYITLTVDGKSVKIEKGSTLLEAARKAGADIPTLCHDERVKPYGACGMCVVECKGSSKLMRSCAIEAADGMEIITESDRINRARRFSLEMLLSDHTGDCKAPCSLACPAGTDCQGYVGLIANGGNAQALSVIKGRIPLPASIGRVCPHPCEKKCRRGLVEEPISIAALKAYAADRDLESGNIFMPEVAESTGKKGRDYRRRSGRNIGGILSCNKRTRRHCFRYDAEDGRHAPLRHTAIQTAERSA